jgi:FkbM family methyltransferase
MNYFCVAADCVVDLLRRNVKRDSWIWKYLQQVRNAIEFLRRNPINKRKWKSNYEHFEDIIQQYSSASPDFFVIQIGACDGVMADPIHKWIKKYGWHGVLVEPQREEFDRLKANYADESNHLCFENVAIAENCGLRPLYKMKNENIKADWQRGTASFLPKPGLEQQKTVATEMVQCITFNSLLDNHNVRRIDLLQIDVEGYDYELLKLFSFKRSRPRLIRYEHINLNLTDKSNCKKYLKRYGYKILEMEDDTGAILKED